MNDVSPNNLDRERAVLPLRWARATPLEIGEAALGKMLDRAKHTKGRALPYVRNLNVRWGTFDLSDLLTMRFRDDEFTRYELRRGDLLICEGGEPGRCAVWNQEGANIKYQKAVHRLRLYDGIDPYFIMYQLMHDARLGRLVKFFTGSTIKHFTGDSLSRLQLRIAPSNEQQRIVAKIDELFSELDAGVASLKRAKALLKKYRQAVLKAAVTGELTRDWRERHQGEIKESGAELLQRILKARRAAWEGAQLKKMRAKGKRPNDDRWKQKYKEPQPPDTTDLPALPEGWVWATLDALAEVVGGITKDAKREARGGVSVPYLRVANVQRGYLDLTKVKEITVDTYTVAILRLMKNDILFNEGGDIDKLGRGWIWQDEVPVCIHQNHVFRARLHLPEFSAKFVSWFANAIGQEYFMREGKQTTNLASVSLSKLKSFPVPVPSYKETAEIEAELERQLTTLDAFEGLAEQEMRRCSALRQSILKAAFAGKLVPQDPNDEPASVLLERIRAERAARPKPPRGRRMKSSTNRQLELLS